MEQLEASFCRDTANAPVNHPEIKAALLHAATLAADSPMCTADGFGVGAFAAELPAETLAKFEQIERGFEESMFKTVFSNTFAEDYTRLAHEVVAPPSEIALVIVPDAVFTQLAP